MSVEKEVKIISHMRAEVLENLMKVTKKLKSH